VRQIKKEKMSTLFQSKIFFVWHYCDEKLGKMSKELQIL
jgi:hypothetical protein